MISKKANIMLLRPAYPEATEFRRNPDYSLYVLTINCVVMGLLPFALLIWMNISITSYFNRSSEETKMWEVLISIIIIIERGVIFVGECAH